MKCPHCLENFHESPTLVKWAVEGQETAAAPDADGRWTVWYCTCPSCQRLVMKLQNYVGSDLRGEFLIRPKAPARSPLAPEVPEAFAADYREACLVLADSAKASAALSRRCLQNVLREHFKVKSGSLSDEIDQVLPSLPTDLADAVDAVRNYGNFAAHPMKSTNSGEILDVEPGEAEWSLDVLEDLFDFCFVRPARLKKKRDSLNQKLGEAGKPPMK